MTVKSSISLTDRQDAFARELVRQGRYSSMSAVVQRGLELVRQEVDDDAEMAGMMRDIFQRRLEGPFVSQEEFERQVEEMLDEKRKALGLEP